MCPVCHHTPRFISLHTQAFVCSACHGILQRGVTYTGTAPQTAFRVEEDMSVFRLGSELEYESVNYTFIGRFQFFLNSSVRNKWILQGPQDEMAWMIEQAGFYAVVRSLSHTLSADELGRLTPGVEFMLSDEQQPVYLESLFKNESTRMEGEVLRIEQETPEFIAADFLNASGDYLFVQVFNKNEHALFRGKYYPFHRLQARKTRLKDEWK